MRALKLAAVLSGALSLRALAPFVAGAVGRMRFASAAAIGVIGGADGPTAIYFLEDAPFRVFLRYGFAVLCPLVFVICVILLIIKSRDKG